MITSREIRLKSRIVGMPSAENFELVTVSLPRPAPGEVQVQNLWMTWILICVAAWPIARLYAVVPAGKEAPGARSGDRRVQLDHVRLAPELPSR